MAHELTFSSETDAAGALWLRLSGRMDTQRTGRVWDAALAAVRASPARQVIVDASGVDYADGAGIALLLKLGREAKARRAAIEVRGLAAEAQRLYGLLSARDLHEAPPKGRERRGLSTALGQLIGRVERDVRSLVAFVGECAEALAFAVAHPRHVRWKDVLLTSTVVGVDSLPIVLLIGFLMGLIMSFQSAVSLQRFGAEIFVPNMLGLVMFREMGPLVTTILLASCSGSAFAAEIGTMKVNEEIDALTTMGVSPMRFLVAPKVIASVTMVPLMTMFFNFASLVGGALVMLFLGYPLATFTSRVFVLLQGTDFAGGLFKALVFSLLVAGVGCLRGLETHAGASGVGVSTTSAVVSGIILIAIADGIFAVTFYYLGI